MHLLLILLPAVLAAVCLALPHARLRLAVLLAGAAGHFVVIVWSWLPGFPNAPLYYFALDPLGHLFVSLISALFLATSVYFLGYHRDVHISQRGFLACMLGLLATMSALCMSQHLGVLWVSMEAASLASTPLIYFHISARSLEATWKFLLMNSVGIAIALLGIFCVAVGTLGLNPVVSLSLADLTARAPELNVTWLRAGFLFVLVGFGTKMGLSPLHSWKPDAYAESPPHVAALLAGGVTLGAFVGILRVYAVCVAAGLRDFGGMWLIGFGLLSVATAAVFVVGNNDYRRILAYTSVEHMGVLAVGVGLGAGGPYAGMLHAMHNTLNKGVLFLVAGFFWRLYESSRVSDVRGALHHHPIAGLLFLGGLCATCGLPPFGIFFSELGIVLTAAAHGRWWVAGLFSLSLGVVFVGLMTAMLPMIFGPPPRRLAEPRPGESRSRSAAMLIPAAVLLIGGFGLGAYQPAGVRAALIAAAQTLTPVPHSESPTVARAQTEETKR
ncbi:MAG: hydrogenase [Candidatus Hydrogenedentota bacterium]